MQKTKMIALLALAACFIGILCFSGLAEKTEETLGPNMKVVKCKEFVSLREKDSTKSKRLLKVPLGAEVLAWLDGGSDEADEFLYCEYQGQSGYILREYLAPIAEAYDTGLGFSFQYNPRRLRVDQGMSESGQSVLAEWYGWDSGPAYLELMLPEAFGQDPEAYLEANREYIRIYTAASGAIVTGGEQMMEDSMLVQGFYIVTMGDQTVLAAMTYPADIAEVVEPDFFLVLDSISFGKNGSYSSSIN